MAKKHQNKTRQERTEYKEHVKQASNEGDTISNPDQGVSSSSMRVPTGVQPTYVATSQRNPVPAPVGAAQNIPKTFWDKYHGSIITVAIVCIPLIFSLGVYHNKININTQDITKHKSVLSNFRERLTRIEQQCEKKDSKSADYIREDIQRIKKDYFDLQKQAYLLETRLKGVENKIAEGE